jgi:glycosyltransferase involved in cell wall biosynthesis
VQVAIFAPGFPPWSIGGEEYYVYYQARELTKLGHDVCVIAGGPADFAYKAPSTSINLRLVKPILVGNSFVRYAFISTRFLFSYLRLKTKPHVIHGHDPYGEGLAAVVAGKILHVPVVITWHAAELIEKRAHFSILGNALRKITLRYTTRVIVNSDFFKRLVANSVGDHKLNAKISVVSPGVDTNEFDPRKAEKPVQTDSGTCNDSVVLAVCRLEKIKGLDVLIGSAPSVLKSFPQAKFVIVGSGSERRSLEELSEKLNVRRQVVFAGNVPRTSLPDYYSNSDVFVIPTRGEGFGMAFLEAWSSGKPIIVTPHAPEIAKLVRTYGGGLIVSDEAESLSQAIIKLLSDERLRSSMGKTGRHVAVSKYSWKHTVQANLQVYAELQRT